MGPVRAGDKTVERHHHLENDFSIGHIDTDLLGDTNSSPPWEIRGGRSLARRPRAAGLRTADTTARASQRSAFWISVLWNAAMAQPPSCSVTTAVAWEWLIPGVGPPGASSVAVAAARTHRGAMSRAEPTR